jgi:DNA-binding FadR family transcriptional regulator
VNAASLAPVSSIPLSEQVYRRLLDAILGGEFTDGMLPSERELATTFQVNRHAIREALKRLQQARLVEVSQGGATRVLDYRTEGRLDLLADLLVRAGTIDWSMALAALEMRSSIGADAAALCAARSPEIAPQLIEVATEMREHLDDAEALDQLNIVYWTALVDGSGNLLYRLSLNTLLDGLAILAESAGTNVIYDIGMDEYGHVDELITLAKAIGAGKADQARRTAQHHLNRTVAAAQT